MDVLLIANDQTITVNGVRDEISGDYINTAEVTATVSSKAGGIVAGPITLDYVMSSDGNYIGNLPNTAELVNNKTYIVEIVAEADGFKATWRFDRTAQYRQP